MRRYHFISRDERIVDYVEAMATWMEQNSDASSEEVYRLFYQNQGRIRDHLHEYSLTIFHDEPAKWAEILATTWELIEEPELEFV